MTSLQQLRHELELNQQALNNTDDLKLWSDLMIQRINLLNMVVERLSMVEQFMNKVG